ncbi:XLF-domain-containing protein [Annulohypoxylon maeteangense]|uniref:XLF-domain-containing protein n=1 Tax=Annulohypoxylon maeteangense TaxID=1927788 RepID=UPI00200825A0|nr:XLF-domain-containing protein [Annulohypoxylon maeteangense]KAI0881552.1 XLF-domain-containing protein [Annulohypoxylon maeteangense]
MDPDLKWHPLPTFPHLPALMISPRFASSSYTFYVTDLASIWVESLDRKGILLRSLQENTSIDLSDGDPNQWSVFLSKLNTAFDPALREEEQDSTSISISTLSSDTQDKGKIALHVTCVLPEPLKPLKWPIYLTKCPPASIASELVLPLIQTHHARTLEMQDLIMRLKDKDSVITKLVDKLEANQIGLEHVFNSLSGKRKPSRALAEEKVKGLAPFNESDWESGVAASRQLPQDISSLIQVKFAETRLYHGINTEMSSSNQLDDWWTKLGSHAITAIKPQKELPNRSQDKPSQDAKKTKEKDDDDFQIQTLPPNLQSRRRELGLLKSNEDTTNGDDSLVETSHSHLVSSQEKPRSRIGAVGGKSKAIDNSLSQSSHTIHADDDETPSESDTEPVLPQPQTRPNTRLGNIGKSKEPSSPLTKPPSAKTSSPLPPPRDDDETPSGSDLEDDDQGPPVSRSSPQAPAPSPRKKAGLGCIGGKSKPRVTPEPSEEPNMTASKAGGPEIVSSPAKSGGRKIGTIGKKPATDGKRQRSGSPSTATATVVEPETEEQKTGRRRAELAKELERKAAAPTKKKRRF